MRHFFSTLDRNADDLILKSLIQLEKSEISIKDVFINLKRIESYDENDKPFFEDADMTKEVIQDVVEHICDIKGISDDDVWEVYDKVYS